MPKPYAVDSWFSPAKSAYQRDQNPDGFLTVAAFDGETYWGYGTEKKNGYRLSKGFVLEYNKEVPIAQPNAAEEQRQYVVDAVAKGDLVQTGEETLGDRSALIMKDTSGHYTQVAVDKETRLPLVLDGNTSTVYMLTRNHRTRVEASYGAAVREVLGAYSASCAGPFVIG